MSAVIVADNLTKRYGALTAVDGVSFEVEAGTIFGLLGPNGAGKTTILECLAGLRRPDGGAIRITRDRVGVALQATDLQGRLTPREALRLFGAFYAAPASPDALLARFALAAKADAAFASLSAGQRQRLALALAFVSAPEVLVLDEPTAGLDPAARRELHGEIRRLRDEGRTVLLSTHDLEEAHALCERVAILRGGRVAACGRPGELIARGPAAPIVAVRAGAPIPRAVLEALPGVSQIDDPSEGEVRFRAAPPGPAVAALTGWLERQGHALLDLRVGQPSLEDAFFELTAAGASAGPPPPPAAQAPPPGVTGDLRAPFGGARAAARCPEEGRPFPRVPWRGLVEHLLSTLRLNFRSRLPLIYGYLVPVFFLLAFGSVFRGGTPPLLHELGQLLTITVLGGACFGLPTALVAERDRGVWRRYRLLPASAGALVLSTSVARALLVGSAALLQMALAWACYRTPWPALPGQFALAFGAVCFAFLGLGLVIAMLADHVPAVQAIGQCVFLPMIMIGGVGVPLRTLPGWARHVAGFLPGRYAVQALDACILPDGGGLAAARFALAALGVIGAAAFAAGGGLFRWDAGPRTPGRGAKGWLALALGAWMLVGLAAEHVGARAARAPGSGRALAGRPAPAAAPWQGVTAAQIAAIPFDDLTPDASYYVPVAPGLQELDAAAKARLDAIQDALAYWPPGREGPLDQRVRNLLSVCAVADLTQDENEGEIALAVFGQVRDAVPADELPRVLAWIILHPEEGAVRLDASEFGIKTAPDATVVRERCAAYAKKLLWRLRRGDDPYPERRGR